MEEGGEQIQGKGRYRHQQGKEEKSSLLDALLLRFGEAYKKEKGVRGGGKSVGICMRRRTFVVSEVQTETKEGCQRSFLNMGETFWGERERKDMKYGPSPEKRGCL